MIGGLLTIDPEKRFSWNDFFEHSFITDEIDDDRDSEIDRLTTSEITKIRNKSDEVVDKLLKDDQSTYTQNIEENKEKPSSHQIYSVESDDFELKPSSTDLKFYDSTASKEDEKDSYVKERKIPNKSKQSLEVVKEASHKTNEEDLEEENKNQLLNMADEGRKNNVERRDDFEITIEEDLDPLLKQDLDKIFEFMTDLLKRSKMILSFYKERKTQEICEKETEIAYLLNKICYESKTFISTFQNSKNRKEESLQIVSDTKENINITDELIKTLKSNSEYNRMIKLIINYFLLMSEQVLKTHYLISMIDDSFQRTLASSLTKYCIDIIEEAIILDEEEQKNEAMHKYSQAQFILDELLREYYKTPQLDSIDGVGNTDSNNGSQCDKSDVMKSSRSHKCMNSIQSQNEFILNFQDIHEDEIDKIYEAITGRIKLLSINP